jgi:hypothetical protein
MMFRRLGAYAAVTAALILLTACAASGTGAGGPGESSEPPSPPATSEPTPAPSGTPRVLNGRVVAGVEPHCLLLRHSTGDYLLILKPGMTPPEVGATIVATGVVEPTRITTCMQGTPFVVTQMHPA